MQWICNIALFLVLSGILLELISDTKYYKFARWVSGVILLLQFLQPITSMEEIWNRFTVNFTSFDYALGTDRVVEDIYRMDKSTENYVQENYKKMIADQIDRKLQSNGLKLLEADITVAEDGTLEGLWIKAAYLDGSGTQKGLIPTVIPVRIGEKKPEKTVSPLALYIRELLAEFYQMDENKLEVVIQEAE